MKFDDIIEKQVVIRAPRSKVWRALTDARQFGTWFRVDLDGDFVPGERITGKMTYPGHEGAPFVAIVERMQPETLFSFRWPAGAEDPERSTPSDPHTLVEFRLEDAPEGTKLTVVESGFSALPEDKRDDAFRGNTEGWSIQTENVRKHVEG